ncbi:MAG: aminoglycoside phosphotransferase family protein [Myxococcaceae bacterium]|nr:aminoglycoside phosphotransferase family protein [Myxococcaceae bacterium]
MFLTPTNLLHYLMDRGTLPPGAMADEDLTVVEAGRRNRNFKVLRGQAQGLFVKQVPMLAAETIGSLHREALCYQLAKESPHFAPLEQLAPRLVDYDPRRHTLTLGLLAESENLNEYHLRVQSFPEHVGALMGQALASYHRESARLLSEQDVQAVFPKAPPWILTIAWNAEQVMPGMGPGQREVIRLLRQAPQLLATLGAVAAGWQPHGLIHGDIKFDNFLLSRGEEGGERLHIIDWELADVGDTAWDVACVLAAYVQLWLAGVPTDSSQTDPAALILQAPHRLEATWPALRSFWEAYRRAMGLAPHQAALHLLRSLHYAGTRFLLTAFEMLPGTQTLTPHATLALRLAGAVLSNPQRAAAELFGLDSYLMSAWS